VPVVDAGTVTENHSTWVGVVIRRLGIAIWPLLPILRSNIGRRRVAAIVLAVAVELIGLRCAPDRLDSVDVIGGQRLLYAVVGGVHTGCRDLGLPQPEGVAELVDCHRFEIVAAVDLPARSGVEEHVAGAGPPVERRGKKRLAQHAGAEVHHANPNVAKPRVVLLVAVGRFRAAVVVYLGEVDVGHGLPDRGGLLELQLPGRLGEFGVEGLKQDTRDTANVRAVGHETLSDAAAVDPRAAVGAVEQETVFQILQQGASRPLLRRSGRWQK
jgi:hypothetical protein